MVQEAGGGSGTAEAPQAPEGWVILRWSGISYYVPADQQVYKNGSLVWADDLAMGDSIDAEQYAGFDDRVRPTSQGAPQGPPSSGESLAPEGYQILRIGDYTYQVPEDTLVVTTSGATVKAGDLATGDRVRGVASRSGVLDSPSELAIQGLAPIGEVLQQGELPAEAEPGTSTSTGGTATPAAPGASVDDLGIDFASMSDEEIEAYVREELGSLAWVLDIPELRTLVFGALRDGDTETGIYAALVSSDWWRSTEPQLRAYTQMLSEDPAQAQRIRTDVALSIRIEAAQLGVTIPPDGLDALADEAIRMGWVDLQGNARGNLLTSAILDESRWRPESVGPGSLVVTMSSLQRTAEEWMVPISEQTAAVWAERIALGETTADAFTAYMADLSKSRFPHLAGIIDQGISPRAHFEPYRQQVAAMLEVDPDQVDLFNDPRFSRIVETHTDQGVRAMTLAETQRYIRSTPEWGRTMNGLSVTAQTLEGVLGAFGETA